MSMRSHGSRSPVLKHCVETFIISTRS